MSDDDHCDRCGVDLCGFGSHYHCAGCDSLAETGMLGHFAGAHFVDGKRVKTEFHHCAPGNCELREATP